MKKLTVVAASALAALASPALAQDWSEAGNVSNPAIYWDEWGVAHIVAAGDEDAAYALGWAQARGRPDQLVELLVRSRGTAASLWGEDYVRSDTLIWTSGLPNAVPSLLAALEPEERRRVDAFVAGINAYFEAFPAALDGRRALGLPITAEDIVTNAQATLYLTFVAGRELYRSQQLSTPMSDDSDDGERGSNGWAIGPSRSASGNSMLLMNPHLPWDGVYTWFESHIVTDDNNVYGVGFLGQPQANVMFNSHLGWTHTVNRLDNADMYAVELTEGGGYMFDGEERAFDVSRHMLDVAMPDGSMTQVPLPILRTVQGPVVARDDRRAYALRIAGFADPDHANVFAQYAAMAGARNLQEFETALQRLQNPMFNTIYADGDGEILLVSNGLHPIRSSGDAAYWDGIVDGSSSETLWSSYHPYEDLIRVANPPSGFVQNSNEPAYTATYPVTLAPSDFPSDFIQPEMRARPQHGIEMLLSDTDITFDEMIEYAHDTRLTFADNVIEDLVRASRADGRDEAMRAATVLENWDRRTNAESRGAALFTLWALATFQSDRFDYDYRWSFDAPERWSQGIADANEADAVEILVQTVQRADAAGVPLDLPWGAVARVPDGNGGTLPSDLGLSSLGAFRTGNFTFRPDTLIPEFSGGTGWVSAIEFAETPRARAILPYGNFEQLPEGIRSQYVLHSEGELREVNFTMEALREATVYGEVLERD